MVDKSALRTLLLSRRKTAAPLTPQQQDRMSQDVMDLSADGGCVAGYWSLSSELDCRFLLDHLVGQRVSCALPVVVKKAAPLLFRRWTPDVALVKGPHHTQHPPETEPSVMPSVILVPLVGFDQKGGRLGYGGGYYDRTIAAARAAGQCLTIGLAFDEQEWGALPLEETDQKLDWILTPTRRINA